MSFNAITKAAKAAAGLVATATTGGDDEGATPITQDYVKVNEFDDQDAEPQPDEEDEKPAAKEDPTAENRGAPSPPKKPRRDEGLPVNYPEGSVAASIARKVGRDLFTALNKELDRQGRTENRSALAKLLLELATELGNTAFVAVKGTDEKLTLIHSVTIFEGNYYALVGEATPDSDPFLIEFTQTWIKEWKDCKVPNKAEIGTALWKHITDNPKEGWNDMDDCDDDKDELKPAILPRLLIAPEPLVRYMATRPSTTPGEAATFLAQCGPPNRRTSHPL